MQRYYIFDDQCFSYLEWSEKSIRDCIERLISYHSIDTYTNNIYMLLEQWWTITNGTDNKTYTKEILKRFSKGKGKRLFNKIRNKYMTNYY